ncbi:probable pectinesterase 55 [Neltuma alba]|uniref:probable pectinesterase 55 n=1 Tax=Neltuma alba TaxID=207710 RepID=UPI0010A332DA|nr:probable pectinesterase 55 [Prosopis alba]
MEAQITGGLFGKVAMTPIERLGVWNLVQRLRGRKSGNYENMGTRSGSQQRFEHLKVNLKQDRDTCDLRNSENQNKKVHVKDTKATNENAKNFGKENQNNISGVFDAKDCSNPSKVIIVGKSGRGRFRTIQRAINSILIHNTGWIHIRISAGNYSEKVTIPMNKPCIFLEGAGSSSTIVQWSDHQQTAQSYTFESNAPNVIAKGIAFQGTLPASAGAVRGDKSAFYDCVFKGVQDTLMDDTGRHYYHNCYIQGETDFIFGKGQSLYENCTIYFKAGPDGREGAIAAQKREYIEETNGYVSNGCHVDGIGKAILGRAYGAYSRVIFANSYLSRVVDPVGWNAWNQHNL